jgi:hypothetical protein
MQSLIDFSFLKFTNYLHILFTDRVLFEVAEFGSVIRKIQEIYFTIVIGVEFFDVGLHVEIVAI